MPIVLKMRNSEVQERNNKAKNRGEQNRKQKTIENINKTES